jgi:tRNA uridine 5-carboxymethylaminomethyl modification enzyme
MAALGGPLERELNALELLKRPGVRYRDLMQLEDRDGGCVLSPDQPVPQDVAEQVEIQAKYSGYIHRQNIEVGRHQAQESALIPADIDYDRVPSLSTEVRQKLKQSRPETLGQAGRVSGVTPAAISLLWVHLKRIRALGGASDQEAA